MSEIPKKYTIDNAKNDIQNLQSQNLYDFQEIKRLDGLIKDYDKRILQAINFNNQINKKNQSLILLLLDRIKNLEDNSLSSNGSGLTRTDVENIVNELIKDLGGSGLTQTDVKNIVNELIGGIQTQISLILDRIKNLEDNSSSTPTVKTYSVTYELNNVICSNNTTTITENSIYSTSLTPYENYSISYVNVTIGGVNVTDTVYSNGVIYIGNVSGNIKITVTAIDQNDNIIKCKNATISYVDGSETVDETRIATDFIPVRISGNLTINSKTTENYRFVVRYFNEDKNFIGNGGSEWILDGQTVTLEPINGINFESVRFLRLIFKSNNIDTNPINTINGQLELESDGYFKSFIMINY